MTDAIDTLADSQTAAVAPTAAPPVRPFYWSVRRELWEHHSLYIAPLIAGGVVFFGYLIGLTGLPMRARAVTEMNGTVHAAVLDQPYNIAAIAIMVTAFIVAIFYCLGALHNERRDRSILFWKSLPVSDLTTVAAKAAIPLVVLPAIAFAAIFAVQLCMLLLGTGALAAHGMDATALWAKEASPQGWWVLLWGLATLSVWFAPLYAWLILVSGWARKAPFLWAVLAPLGLSLAERITLGTSHLSSLLGSRLTGGFSQAFAQGGDPLNGLPRPDPAAFVSAPAVWIGVIVAAAFLAAAVWLRRRREPV
ncbi:MAG: hypothetical protein ABI376_04630 [Caulobacteraceae bacterium]